MLAYRFTGAAAFIRALNEFRLSSALGQRTIVATFASIANRISANATLRLQYELQSRT